MAGVRNHCKLCSDEIDLLLLGAAEAGKSTLLKQMRIIHKADYGLEERIMFKPIVYANAIHSMSLILHAVERLGIDLDSEESEYDAYVFYQLLEEQTSHMHTLVEDIKVTKELSKVALVVFGCKSSPISRNVRSLVSQSVRLSVIKCKKESSKAQ